MSKRDYYEVLGVNKNSTPDEIKKYQRENGLTVSGFLSPQTQAYIDRLASEKPPVDTAPPAPEPGEKPTEDSEYIKYLKSMFNPEDARMARENLESLNQKTSEEMLRTRKEEDRIRENKDGALLRGLNAQLNEEARASNRSLADLALAKGVATTIYEQYIAAGKSIEQAEQAALKTAQDSYTTVSPGQTIVDANGKVIYKAEPKVETPNVSTAVIDIGDKKVLVDKNTGEILQEYAETGTTKKSSSSSSKSSAVVNKLTSAQKSPFTAAGFTAQQIADIQSDISEFGLQEVYNNLNAKGKAALQEAYPSFKPTNVIYSSGVAANVPSGGTVEL
jgi:curved DNA-binding protein CbpA